MSDVAGSPVPFLSEEAEIGPVVWATEIEPETKAPRAPLDVVPSDAPTIYATLPLASVRRGTSIVATWSYNGTPLEGLDSRVVADRDQRDVWIEFHIDRRVQEPWPEGTYTVEVTADGQLAQTAAVVVRARATS